MEYDTITGLSQALDNIYSSLSKDGSRKTLAKLVGDEMHITYMTILNVAKDSDLRMQMDLMKKETNDMINSRLRTIKSEFKSSAGRALVTKKIGMSDNVETLTVSPYSPFRKLKYSCTCKFEVK